jgi:hypothetical protein
MGRRTHVTEVAIYRLVYSGCWMRVVQQIPFYVTLTDTLFAAEVPEVVVLFVAC